MEDIIIPHVDIAGINKPTQRVLTAQELLFIGSSVEHTPHTTEEWYIPQAILDRELDPVDVKAKREELGPIRSVMYPQLLGIKKGPVCIELAPINSKGKTDYDPRIEGVWDGKIKKIVKVKDRDLTKEILAMFSESKRRELHLRPSIHREKEGARGLGSELRG